MRETKVTCDICGKPVRFDELDFEPKVTVTVEYNPRDLVYRSLGNTRVMDLCRECSGDIRKWIGDKQRGRMITPPEAV